jgi:ascorbate-specific PTS system EIIC-type component UlaA
MKRGIAIIIGGICMLIGGHFLSQMVLDVMPTINPANSSLIADTNYHMMTLSNQLSTASQFGVIVLLIGAITFFIDRRKSYDSKKS